MSRMALPLIPVLKAHSFSRRLFSSSHLAVLSARREQILTGARPGEGLLVARLEIGWADS